jgi:HEPN domain-containing protein
MSEPLVEEWIKKAEEDYETAEYLYKRSKRRFPTSICFHAQQSVEKYLKALLMNTCLQTLSKRVLYTLFTEARQNPVKCNLF